MVKHFGGLNQCLWQKTWMTCG